MRVKQNLGCLAALPLCTARAPGPAGSPALVPAGLRPLCGEPPSLAFRAAPLVALPR